MRVNAVYLTTQIECPLESFTPLGTNVLHVLQSMLASVKNLLTFLPQFHQ